VLRIAYARLGEDKGSVKLAEDEGKSKGGGG